MKLLSTLLCAAIVPLTATATMAVAARTPPATTTVPTSASAAGAGSFARTSMPQQVLPGSVLVVRRETLRHVTGTGARKVETARRNHSDQQFFAISRTGGNDVPEAALRAYRAAATSMSKTTPGCGIGWTMLAAIGRVESDHGRYGGSTLGTDGVSRPAIVGPRLDGAGPFAAIPDSENGRLDGDRLWDRAVGPMQFLPSTWRAVARDGDGDGKTSPNDLDDAALGAAVYLCGAGNLSGQSGMGRAAFRYNQSDYYVALVLAYERGYRTGVFVIPADPAVEADAEQRAARHAKRRAARLARHAAHQLEQKAKAKAEAKTKAKTKTKTRAAAKPKVKNVAKPAAHPVSKPAPKPAPKPVPKATPKPAPAPVAKPTVPPAPSPSPSPPSISPSP